MWYRNVLSDEVLMVPLVQVDMACYIGSVFVLAPVGKARYGIV